MPGMKPKPAAKRPAPPHPKPPMPAVMGPPVPPLKGKPTAVKMKPPAKKPQPNSSKMRQPKQAEAETYKGKSMAPGGGGRFAKLEDKLEAQGKSEESAKAIAATVGRKKFGKQQFQAMAAAGKKKSA